MPTQHVIFCSPCFTQYSYRSGLVKFHQLLEFCLLACDARPLLIGENYVLRTKSLIVKPMNKKSNVDFHDFHYIFGMCDTYRVSFLNTCGRIQWVINAPKHTLLANLSNEISGMLVNFSFHNLLYFSRFSGDFAYILRPTTHILWIFFKTRWIDVANNWFSLFHLWKSTPNFLL